MTRMIFMYWVLSLVAVWLLFRFLDGLLVRIAPHLAPILSPILFILTWFALVIASVRKVLSWQYKNSRLVKKVRYRP